MPSNSSGGRRKRSALTSRFVVADRQGDAEMLSATIGGAWPTEDAATKAVDAAARKAFEDARRETSEATRIPIERYADWDNAGKVVQLQWRQRVLPLVWAALDALDDPRYGAWVQGHAAGYREASLPGEEPDPNPFPFPEA